VVACIVLYTRIDNGINVKKIAEGCIVYRSACIVQIQGQSSFISAKKKTSRSALLPLQIDEKEHSRSIIFM
jgi:hypothetical protein